MVNTNGRHARAFRCRRRLGRAGRSALRLRPACRLHPACCRPTRPDPAPASSGKRASTPPGEGKVPKMARLTPDGGAEALEDSPVEDPERVADPGTGPEVKDTVIVCGLPPNLCLAC